MPNKPPKLPLDDRAKSLSNLYAQKALALSRNDTKTAAQIQKIIDLIEKRKDTGAQRSRR